MNEGKKMYIITEDQKSLIAISLSKIRDILEDIETTAVEVDVEDSVVNGPIPPLSLLKGKTIGIVVGHDKVSKGANSISGESEFSYNTKLADHIYRLMLRVGAKPLLVYRQPGPYTQSIKDAYGLIGRGADVIIELHFNAAGDPYANGCECLIYKTGSVADHVGQGICSELASLGFRNRGNKVVGKGENGYGSLVASASPVVIVETGFGTSPFDWERMQDFSGVANAIVAGIEKGLK